MKKKTTSQLNRPTQDEYADAAKTEVAVVLDNIRSANNVGSFFRTCDAFAIGRLVLCGITATPPSAEIRKTALGAEQTVEWCYCGSAADAVRELVAEGYVALAVEQVEGAAMLGGFAPLRGVKYALVFGNEVDGVSQEALDECGGAVEIPQAGVKHSLNVAVAGGVVLWCFFAAAHGTAR